MSKAVLAIIAFTGCLSVAVGLAPEQAGADEYEFPEDCGMGCRCAAFAEQAPEGLTIMHPSAPNVVEVMVNGQWIGDLFLCCDPADNRCRDIWSGPLARKVGLPGRDCGSVNLPELASCLGAQIRLHNGYQLFITTAEAAE